MSRAGETVREKYREVHFAPVFLFLSMMTDIFFFLSLVRHRLKASP